jgi:pimeloyl-ACP methyl ester carboxylesterase
MSRASGSRPFDAVDRWTVQYQLDPLSLPGLAVTAVGLDGQEKDLSDNASKNHLEHRNPGLSEGENRVKRGRKYWVRLLTVGLIGGLTLACVVIELIYVVSVSRPAPSLVGNPPQDGDDIVYLPITLYNQEEHIQLSGWYIPSQNSAAVILLHGFGSNRLEMVSRAEALARHGFGVLLYDLRGHGESQGDSRTFGWGDLSDVESALQFLADRDEVDPERIGILGFSTGGQIALRAAAEYDQIQAVIADDPAFVTVDDAPRPVGLKQRMMYLVSWVDSRLVSLWTGTPIPPGIPEVLGAISPRPILFIDTGEAEGRLLVRYFYQAANDPKELWEIPETYHGGQFAARPQEYGERMIAFFYAALLDK